MSSGGKYTAGHVLPLHIPARPCTPLHVLLETKKKGKEGQGGGAREKKVGGEKSGRVLGEALHVDMP